ncbi:ornithine cyclodeaminase family protein [Corallococcus sp. H22C18031201]|uniref:ornithine cyclodeaminase family protein n=1 Tax=Citreicoccus inhibens TaxID=2849499 RepID=UPI000E7453A7|nr:ornithine cyclodeaminase family protein [Citreicoccus inhibens]MBU8899834.1 ornithine cyclodeaminase family protein [Citreicoccus inhibens]RJS21829.1 ornithine cyclodeaminase family protein [Corallococcus sp. H22C18031201]
MRTLLLSRSDVSRNLQSPLLLEDLREGCRADALARTVAAQGPRVSLHLGGTAMVRFPGCLPNVPAYSVKVSARFPARAPAVQGVVQLHDLGTGELMAVMDSGHLTAVGLGVMGALGADVLARPEARRVALLGTGASLVLQLKSLRLVRSLEHVRVFEPTDASRTAALAARLFTELDVPVRVAESQEEALVDADLIVVDLASRQPLPSPSQLPPGAHLTVLGMDESGGGDAAVLLRQQTLFACDHRGLLMGPAAVEPGPVELGEVLAGLKPGRTSASQVTVFAPVGPPLMDLTAAWHVYQSAQADEALHGLDFGG